MSMEVESSNTHQIKFSFGQEIRRIAFTGISYESLTTEIKRVLNLPNETVLSLKYQDEDQDWITVSSDVELLTAFQIHRDKVIRMTVSVANAPAPVIQTTPMAFETTKSLIPTNSASYPTFFQPQPPQVPGYDPSAPQLTHGMAHNQYVPRPHQNFSVPAFMPSAYSTTSTSTTAENAPVPGNLSPEQQAVYYKHSKDSKPWKQYKEVYRDNYKQLYKEQKREWKEQQKEYKKEWKEHKKDWKEKKEDGIKGKMAARFVSHVTIEDDTPLSPGTAFIKTWRFRNESNVPWPTNTCMLCVGKQADRMGPDVVPVTKFANPGEEVDVSVPLVAPTMPGKYVGYYRLGGGPKGGKFGQRVRVQIQVI